MELPPRIRIAIVTDTHIGFTGITPKVVEDSYDVFDEVLETAESAEADMIIHAGDLFDSKTPTNYAIRETLKFLRQHVVGDLPPEKKPLSVICAEGLTENPNWLESNPNIKLPFFLIHGNHDNICGIKETSANQILAVTKYVNLFKPKNEKGVIT